MDSDFHSTHCNNCINFAQCNKVRKLRKSRGEDEKISCPIVVCSRVNCGHKFHACKRSEHDLLCLRIRVPCINKEFGCPMIMERGDRGIHLETCPASVIVCTMEWNRWPLPPGKEQPFHMNPDQLDVASNLRDQQTLTEWKEFVPPTLRYLLKTDVNERHPVMPLGVSGLRIPKSILNQAIIEQNLRMETDNSESTESEQEESSDSPWGWKKCPPGLQESVCNKLKALTMSEGQNGVKVVTDISGSRATSNITNGGHQDHAPDLFAGDTNGHENGFHETCVTANNDPPAQKIIENGTIPNSKRKKVDLSLMVEVRTRCQRKPEAMYTFMCSREFRRDEFPNHFSHIHSRIHTQLNGWLFTRCPMSNLGCGFGLERMQPVDENYNVVYNSTADAFCFTQQNFSSLDSLKSQNMVLQATKKTDTQNTVSLSSLPFELLVHLTKFLDPLSLNSLSMTNRIFRDACSCVVVDRGIVVFQWEKKPQDQMGWEVTEKKWIFSSAFSPIKKWKFGDPGRMINHMKTCSFFERNIPTKPFAYPVTKEQL